MHNPHNISNIHYIDICAFDFNQTCIFCKHSQKVECQCIMSKKKTTIGVFLSTFGYVRFRTWGKVNRLHSRCCGSFHKFLIILNYSWLRLPGLNVKCRIYFIASSARNHCHVLGFTPLDSVTSLIHILSKADIICMRISPNSANVTRPRQGITTWLSY